MRAMACAIRVVMLCIAMMTCNATTIPPTPTPPLPPSPVGGTYLLTAPSIIRPGQTYSINLAVNRSPDNADDLTCSASLTSSQGVLVSGNVGNSESSSTLHLEVPLEVPQSSYKLEVKCEWTMYQGGLVFFNDSKSVRVEQKSMSLFVQTDKAIYKPGQKVMFRVLGMYPDLKPYLGAIDIDIYDPNSNKIVQLADQQNTQHGVIKGEMQLSDQPVLGDWQIRVEAAGQMTDKPFTVEEYVLPKYEVSIITPSFITKDTQGFELTIEGKYTYGEMVKGSAVIVVKLNYRSSELYRFEQPMPELRITVPKFNGRYTRTITRKELIGLVGELKLEYRYSTYDPVAQLPGRKVVVNAAVTEGVTSVTLDDDHEMPIERARLKLEFLAATPSNFKPGLDYIGFVKLSLADGQPPASSDLVSADGTPIQLEMLFKSDSRRNPVTGKYEQERIEQSYPMPASGIVRFVFTVPDNFTRFQITGAFQYITINKYGIQEFKTKEDYGIQVSLQGLESGGSVQAGDTANFIIRLTDASAVDSVQLLLLSKGVIVESRSLTNPSQTTMISIFMTDALAQQLAPSATAVVWCVADSEVIADSLKFNVEGAFANEVSLTFNKEKTKPGTNVKMTVNTYKNSYVGVLAVDQSVLLLKSGNDITQDQVLDELSEYDSTDIGPMPRRRCFWCFFPYFPGGVDSSDIFQKAGLIIMTNIFIFESPLILRRQRPTLFQTDATKSLAQPTRVRRLFPETWLWIDSADVGPSGKWTLSTKVPDTITSWIVTAFSVSGEKGLGVVPEATKLTVFKPFFVSLNLPYSVIRGEEFGLQANVFNYMTSNLQVTVTLSKSDDFTVRLPNSIDNAVRKDVVLSVTVPANDARSVWFWIVPEKLGNIKIPVTAQTTSAADALERMLLVQPEGSPEEYTRTVIFDFPTAVTTPHQESVDVTYPSDVVSGSEHVIVTAVGAIMGSSIQGLGKLLQMPYGCGEQNMVNFAPAIPILQYLVASDQLTAQLKTKAYAVLNSGYKRELQYQHKDGSFSAFGDRDKVGSMWLTAFVMQSFTQANQFISIDPNIMERAVKWVVANQAKDGSFPERGSVCHKAMQGGSSKGVALTAYVLAALIQAEDAFSGTTKTNIRSAIDSAVSLLVTELATMDAAKQTYEMAIVVYALSLAGNVAAIPALAKLDNVAIKGGGMTHWEKPGEVSTTTRRPYHIASSTSIELTAYMLFTYMEQGRKLTAVPIMKWLATQRNPNGGFSSTQDSVLAIGAMAKLAAKLSGSDITNMDISLTSAGQSYNFDTITGDNALVMQSKELPAATNRVDIAAVGQGLALVQVTVSYHVMSDEDKPGIELNVTTKDLGSGKMTVRVCGKYTKEGASGMVVHEVGILTGSRADTSKLTGLEVVKRIEIGDKNVVLYLDKLTSEETCLDIDTAQEMPVANVQPALISSYQYYTPEVRKNKHYGAMRAQSMCESCPQCCKSTAGTTDKCSPNPCKNLGKCKAAKNKFGYKCRCRRGSGGRRCARVYWYNCGKKNPCSVKKFKRGWRRLKASGRFKFVRCYKTGACRMKRCGSGKVFNWIKAKCVPRK